ncbi:MAG: hypothetical protein HZA53_02110 [Planctomycetes bacterium]|nr:hypothetical protein [Planctomycetota bacterium]
MKSQRWIAWVVLGAWLVWMHALQAWCGRGGALWIPDLALVLLFSVVARIEPKDAPGVVLVALFARAALAVEPGAALAAGLLGLVLLELLARNLFELTQPAWRALFAGVMVLAFDAWLAALHALSGGAGPGSFVRVLAALVPAAFTSAIVSLLLGPALAHLPGLAPLRSRRW